MTREDVFTSDRGERKYYESKRSLKEQIRLPLTLDGCEALLEMVTKALEIPLDETTRQVFAGYVHHLPQTVKHTTFGDIGSLLYNHMSKAVTWKLDQNAKEERKAREDAAKLETDPLPLTLAPEGTDATSGEQTVTQ